MYEKGSVRQVGYVQGLWITPWNSIQTCTPEGHLYRVTYTRYCIDTINSPDDGHVDARSM
jgi:hypothetical protein